DRRAAEGGRQTGGGLGEIGVRAVRARFPPAVSCCWGGSGIRSSSSSNARRLTSRFERTGIPFYFPRIDSRRTRFTWRARAAGSLAAAMKHFAATDSWIQTGGCSNNGSLSGFGGRAGGGLGTCLGRSQAKANISLPLRRAAGRK